MEKTRVLHLYVFEDNVQKYVVIRDYSRDEDDSIMCDFDLSDEEIKNIKEQFEAGNYNENNRIADWFKWEPFENFVKVSNRYEMLA